MPPKQVALIAAPFKATEKPGKVATLKAFTVTTDLSGVLLPEVYELRAYVWVFGKAAEFAALSYNPVPGKPIKSGLWRLSPEATGAVAENQNSVAVTLPRSLSVARLAVFVRGVFNPIP